MKLLTPFLRLIALIALFLLNSQQATSQVNKDPSYQILQIKKSEIPEIDGRLTDLIWQKASVINTLQMVEPTEGGKPSQRTEIKIAATTDALYFGIYCYDSSPDKITSFTMQRDARLREEDHIKLVLDTFLSGRTGYVFAVNPNGARYDALISGEGLSENLQWDGIWEAAANRTEFGWIVEIYLPVKTLRFRNNLDRWGFNIERRIQRNQETLRWTAANQNYKVTHINQGGLLTGIPDFKQGLGLTIRPFTQVGGTRQAVNGSAEGELRAGLDIMKNFGGNVTGLISINTDFAETEVDARRMNLTRFSLFYPEKRTFFLEGSDVFDFGLGLSSSRSPDIVPFFSRRIGLVNGQTVPISHSFKATGSLGQFNFGILNTMTSRKTGIAPRANLFAARGYQNINKKFKLGFIATAGDPLGRNDAWTGGFDFTYKTTTFQGDKNFLAGIWGLMNKRDGLGNDRTAWGVSFDYPNDLWDIFLTYKRIGRDFDPSLGFVPWKGIQKLNLGFVYQPRPNLTWLRQMFNELFIHWVWDLDGTLYRYSIFTAPINWRFESGDRIEVNFVPTKEVLPESFELSPGVEIEAGTYNWNRYRIEWYSASKRSIMAKLSWWFGEFYNGNLNQYQGEINWRPSHKINVGLQGEIAKGRMKTGLSDMKLLRTRFDLYFNPDFQILNFIQYDNITQSLGLNMRLRWTYRSIFDVFLVYNRNWIETQGRFHGNQDQIFLKVQYSWRH